jgi:DNA sulfur modification protein DndB
MGIAMSDSPITSGKFLVDEELDREYRLRNKDRFEQSIDKEASIPEGWKVLREYKTKTRIYRDKSISRRLEDKVWKLFYLLGARKLSTNDFRLLIREQKRKKKSKQLDVVAIVDDNVFVVECKTRKKLGRKSLKKDIAEFAAIKSQISNSLRRALDRRDLQFIFVLATENINWYENDTIDADETAIIRRDEYDIMALTELAQLAGEGAKFQIYNRIFFEKKVKGFDVKVPALKSKMGGHTYYSFILPPVELLKISYVHHREGPSSFLDLANSYQRMIKKSRIRKIESFIQDGGFFPGNIILNFHKRFPKEEPIGDRKHLDVLDQSAKPVAITLPPYFGSAWIIDGQHRLYGFADIPERATETLPVIAFVEESPSLEAEIFVDINDNQKPIGANLLWDLYEDLYRDSSNQNEQQLYAISRIAKELNSRTDSPFNSHIQIPKEQNRGNITLLAI